MTEKEAPSEGLPTQMDQDCAHFVKDALFPLQRDWGSHHKHGHIHPAAKALDKLRAALIEKRFMAYSTIFPKGVIWVPNSQTMESNGQPDVDESRATVEVLPNLLTVKCTQCPRFHPKAYVTKGHEIVVCSNHVLQSDYRGRGFREDVPSRSLHSVEETLARELSKFQVSQSGDPLAYPFVSQPSLSCEVYVGLEALAARAAECFASTDDEIRIGSAIPLKGLGFSWLPKGIQEALVSRCVRSVASQHVKKHDASSWSPPQTKEGIAECLRSTRHTE